MEKVLLVMALLGSAHLAVRGVGQIGRLVFSLTVPKVGDIRRGRQVSPVSMMVVRKDNEEDWAKYDTPTFIRRGIPMPVLESEATKESKARKRRSRVKSEAGEKPVKTDSVSFEIVA